MTAAARQSLPGGLRPSSVPIDSDAAGGLSPRSESRSLAGDRRPSTFPVKSEVRAAENVDEPELDDEMRRISNGGGSGSGAPPPPPPPPPPPIATPKGPSASLALTGNTYTDSATESDKTVKYTATWSGGAKEDYIMVQWVKGYMKNPAGKPYKAKVYGKVAEINFADWVIDSTDEDPAYWSDATGRWTYTIEGPDKFSATDSPGPMYTSDGVGAESKLSYKMAVYKTADVPTKTTGTISATPLSSFQPWDYNVVVQGGGKFKH